MPHNPFITGEKVYLRAFEDGDESVIAEIENNPEARKTLYYAFPTSPANQKDKVEKIVKDPNSIILTICNPVTDEAIGQTAFFRIDWVGRMAIFYIGIAQTANRSKGFGSETVNLMLDYAFRTLNLNRIQLHVSVKNVAAVKVYKKCGFIIEGTLREAMFNEGEYSDFYVMGLLKKDWQK